MKYLSEEDFQKYSLRLLKNDKDDEEDNDILEQNNNLNELENLNLNFKTDILGNKEAFKMTSENLIMLSKNIVLNWKKSESKFQRWSIVFKDSDIFKFDEIEVSPSISFMKKQISIPIGICFNFYKWTKIYSYNIKLASFLDFVMALTPSINIGACINIGFDYNWQNKEYYFFIEAYGKAEISLTADLGLYVPSNRTMFSVSINIGIHGIIGAGRVGCKLKLYFISKNEFILDTYYQIKAFEFSFYIMLKFTFSIPKIINVSFQIYLFDKLFALAIKYEVHSERTYEYFNKTPLTCKVKKDLNANFFKNYPIKTDRGNCKKN